MANVAPFEEHTDRYEGWFTEYDDVYRSELEALDRLVTRDGDGLAIGVGSGRFAAPLGIDVGVDPSSAMLDRARDRGIETVRGVAERLPFEDGAFDTALLVTTICFVGDIPETLAEAARVLNPDGALVLGYIDRDSPVGEMYQEHKDQNPFYKDATFVSTDELLTALEGAGFTGFEFVQTIYQWIDEIDGQEPIKEGYGDGSFVGIKATQ